MQVGDWVRTRGAKYQLDFADTIRFSDDEIELWQPQPNEWCWFETVNTGYELGQFVEFLNNGSYRYRLNSTNSLFNCSHCEPFIGTLPSGLKDKS